MKTAAEIDHQLAEMKAKLLELIRIDLNFQIDGIDGVDLSVTPLEDLCYLYDQITELIGRIAVLQWVIGEREHL